MNRMLAGIVTGTGGLLFSSICANANTVPLAWCDGCTATQMQDTAKAQVGAAGGTVYVGNLSTRAVQAYYVHTEVDDTGSPPYPHIKHADPVIGTSPYQDVGNALISYYYAAPAGWEKSLGANLGGSFSGPQANFISAPYGNDRNINVYDVINPGVAQNNLTDWAKGWKTTYMNYIGVNLTGVLQAFKAVDTSHLPSIRVEITFNDGSRITLKEDFTTDPPTVTADETSGRDSHNNNVPATKAAATCNGGVCTYSFDGPGNPTDFQNWNKQMNLLGFTVVGGSGSTGGGSGGWHGWACVKSGDGEKAVYTCTYH